MAGDRPHAIPELPAWRARLRRLRERIVELSLLACGLASIAITVAICYVVAKGTIEFFQDDTVSISYFFTGSEWTAGFQDAKYGILPLLAGTFMVAAIAALVAMPVGLITAVYLSEYASPRVRGIVKPILELLAGIPTVVYGYFALTAVTPVLLALGPPEWIHHPQNQLSGGLVVGIMIIPIVASLSEDALRSVPKSLREGSLALGANNLETITRVVIPSALSGIVASFLLAISRAVGETMAVSLACGDKPVLTLDPREGVATMTSFIVRAAQGDVPHGSTYFKSLFAVAGVLFVVTLTMNIFAQWILKRFRLVYQ
ncbi:MAG TPA: phosphate ABC transporter permease subunit PstC [Gemmatales bacterium]|nr:phosphate ABC transporter permease subunit PstC [Gemmatales bacterium]